MTDYGNTAENSLELKKMRWSEAEVLLFTLNLNLTHCGGVAVKFDSTSILRV